MGARERIESARKRKRQSRLRARRAQDAIQGIRPETISRLRKERFILTLSEEEFRDRVVRPLFLRQGLKDGRDTCGPREEGKDAVFISEDRLGIQDVYAVQTKKGSVNLSGDAKKNLHGAIVQLRTALETPVFLIAQRKKVLPAKVFLCVSGKINDQAQKYIVDEVKDPRLAFLGSDDLITKIDEVFPELWFDLDTELLPYFRAIKANVDESSHIANGLGSIPTDAAYGAAADEMFVLLRLHRSFLRAEKRDGKVQQVPQLEQIAVTNILKRRERLILIFGEAGSGKSTCMRRLAYLLASKGLKSEAEFVIPVLLRAVDIMKMPNVHVAEVAAAETRRLSKSEGAAFGAKELQAGRVVILVDALDEISDEADQKNVILALLSFHEQYPRCQIILSSRNYAHISGYDEISYFQSWTLSPIDYAQAEKILDRIRSNVGIKVEDCQEILRRLQHVHGMDLNPLLVTVFAATSDYSGKDIPANITELFKKFTEMMLGRWDAGKGLAQQFHAPLKDFVLTKVAFEMHRRGVTNLDVATFKAIVRGELEQRGHGVDAPSLIGEIIDRSGLFRIIGGNIEFRHLLMQEFFAGRGIPAKGMIEALIVNPWWQRAIVFYFGQNPGDAEAIRHVVAAQQNKEVGDVYQASLALGLGLQACYLLETTVKRDILASVVVGLSSAKEAFLKSVDTEGRFPLSRFLSYYLIGRESVACDVLSGEHGYVLNQAASRHGCGMDPDMPKFWVIIGLIESGDLETAATLIRQFQPSDPRLLLAIHLGCWLIEHLRVGSPAKRRQAAEIYKSLFPHTAPLRGELMQEFKSELLEIRAGKIHAIELPGTPATQGADVGD